MANWFKSQYWEDRFQNEDTPWELDCPSPTLVRLERDRELLPRSRVLVPGCGRGLNALYFSELGYRVSVVDFAQEAIFMTRNLARKRGVEIEALCSDFWEIPKTWFKTFDVIAEHTFFCSIDPQLRENYVAQIRRLLRPEGTLLGNFFVTAEASGMSLAKSGVGPPFSATESEVRGLFEPHFDMSRFGPSPESHPDRSDWEWELCAIHRN